MQNILSEKLKLVVQKIQEAGFRIFLVGGCVRDYLLRKDPKDFDFCTDATPDQISQIFLDRKDAGKIFGVSIVQIGSGEFVEIATLRKDGSYTDGRKPDSIIFTDSVQEDAERRDLTINSLYFDLQENKILDFFGGQQDLQDKIIRAVGDPTQRFTEDHLRLLRVVRFASVLDFDIEEKTFQSLKQNSHLISKISMERIRDEFMKSLSVRGIKLLIETGLMEFIVPELLILEPCEQDSKHHPEGDVLVHSLNVLRELKNEDSILKLAGLLHDIGKPDTQTKDSRGIHFIGHDKVGAEIAFSICRRLMLSLEQTNLVGNLVKDHMKAHQISILNKANLCKFLRKPHIEELMRLQRADSLGSLNPDKSMWDFYVNSSKSLEEVIKSPALITGRDLINLGLKPGPEFKIILAEIRDKQDNGEIQTKEEALSLIRR